MLLGRVFIESGQLTLQGIAAVLTDRHRLPDAAAYARGDRFQHPGHGALARRAGRLQVTRDDLARMLDHSVLKPEATLADVLAGAEVVRQWRVGYYCVQPCWVAEAARALHGSGAKVVSVIGFPHGCSKTATKVLESRAAVEDGARELDMVLNVGMLRSGRPEEVRRDVASVVHAAPGIPVKVILETGALDDAGKRLACRIVRDAGAAFVKTSTGFHPGGGATVADVRLMREEVGPAFGVKASGGIRSLADVQAMIDAGANRIGTSASAAILAGLPGA
jgi:deoxyribose-phosphate aldolase